MVLNIAGMQCSSPAYGRGSCFVTIEWKHSDEEDMMDYHH